MRFFVFILLFSLLLSSCTDDEKPANPIPEDTYIDMLIELQLLKSYQEKQYPDSTTMDSLRQAIFKKYEVSEATFQASHEYYQQDIEQQNARIQEAIERLRKDRISAEEDSTTSDSTKDVHPVE